ncbi:MAG: zinc ABC transporter substrate-binding protein [Clostridia bacterium]|nr:zinc ABC transporter substrate-binding protein [Clostridia bacterium]
MKKRLSGATALVLRRLLPVLLACCLLPFAAVGEEHDNEPIRIVTMIFPAFDFARQVVGSEGEVTMLLAPGADSHSYEPSPKDLLAIQDADLFIYTGGESDTWLETILASMGKDAPHTLRMMDVTENLREEHSASMQSDHDHDAETCTDETHDHAAEAQHEEAAVHAHEEAMDEHVWTSPQNAIRIVNAVADALCGIRPASADAFRANAAAYTAQIREIDLAFAEVVAGAKRDLIIFGDRFPLRYFAAAYGLRYDAAFPGCSEDSEPSVRTVISLVDTVRAEGVPVVFHIEYSSQKTARILAEETGAQLRLFHGCHTVSAQEIAQGATYVSLMRQNIEVLKEALN